MISEEYKYVGVPLTPAIMEELILDLFNGRLQERQTIVEEVLAYHESKGGTRAKAMDVPRSLKKALSNLKKKGLAQNPTHGFWRIGGHEEAFESENGETTTSQSQFVVETEPAADHILGTGISAVYLYYLPLYRIKALSENEVVWPCKIGRTDRDPLQRVLSQASTALPEKPHISLIVKTDVASHLEAALHGILTVRNRRIDSAPGTEWFLTSPDEVLEIVKFILPDLVI
jgi:hypothetical protein